MHSWFHFNDKTKISLVNLTAVVDLFSVILYKNLHQKMPKICTQIQEIAKRETELFLLLKFDTKSKKKVLISKEITQEQILIIQQIANNTKTIYDNCKMAANVCTKSHEMKTTIVTNEIRTVPTFSKNFLCNQYLWNYKMFFL